MSLFIAIVTGIIMAAVSPFAAPPLFGRPFAGAVPMLLILLAASGFLVVGQVLGSALTGAGDPGPVARAQLLSSSSRAWHAMHPTGRCHRRRP